jgi:hypothetical protein
MAKESKEGNLEFWGIAQNIGDCMGRYSQKYIYLGILNFYVK